MVTAIIDAGEEGERLPALLAALTPAAVDGVVREVIIAGGGPKDFLEVLREETGAELAVDLGAAVAQSRSPWLLVLPGAIELNSGWIETLGSHIQGGGGPATLPGQGGGLFKRRSEALLVGAEAALALAHPDLHDIRRALARGRARRLG